MPVTFGQSVTLCASICLSSKRLIAFLRARREAGRHHRRSSDPAPPNKSASGFEQHRQKYFRDPDMVSAGRCVCFCSIGVSFPFKAASPQSVLHFSKRSGPLPPCLPSFGLLTSPYTCGRPKASTNTSSARVKPSSIHV